MQLPKTAEYALRVMVEIMTSGDSSATDLTRRTHIPLPFLFKVLRGLVQGGLLVSRKGPAGGYRLARPPGSIRIDDILKAAGYRINEEHCLFGWKRCGGKNPCPLHASWKAVKESFQRWAEETTLDRI